MDMKGLRILYTADIHGFFFPPRLYGENSADPGLLSLMSTFERDGNTLLIDGGDTLQGSPFTDYLQRSGTGPEICAGVMNLAGYDYVVLGNHDLDYGTAYLARYLRALGAKCLCANIRDRKGVLPIWSRDIRRMRNGLRVGLTGICTQKLMRWEKKEILDELDVRDPVACAAEELEALKGKTDLSICVYHGGFEFDPVSGKRLSRGQENRAEAVCALGFDLVLCAHQHRSMPGVRQGTAWAAQVPNRGREYCRVDLSLSEAERKASFQAVTSQREPFEAARVLLAPVEEQVQAYLDRPIGRFTQPLESAPPLVSAFRGSPIANLINRVQAEAAGTRISACSLQNDQKGFPALVTIREIHATYRFPNTLVVLSLTGREIKEYLEQCVRYFTLLETGEVTVSREYVWPKPHHYHYDYLYGLEYTVDLRNPPGERVECICRKWDGTRVEMEDREEICFNSYRASGIGGFDLLKGKKVIREIEGTVPELLIRFMQRHGTVDVDRTNPVRFCDHERLFVRAQETGAGEVRG